MSLINSFVGALGHGLTNYNFHTIASTYNDNMLLLNDTVSVVANSFGVNISSLWDIPLPLVGFKFDYATDLPFIQNEHSVYPYLNKQLLIEGAIRQPADFSIYLHHIVTSLNPFIAQQITNAMFVDAIDFYDRKGGTFCVNSPHGTLPYCVLTGLYGITTNNTERGTTFRMDLKTLVPISNLLNELVGNAKRMAMGIVGREMNT